MLGRLGPMETRILLQQTMGLQTLQPRHQEIPRQQGTSSREFKLCGRCTIKLCRTLVAVAGDRSHRDTTQKVPKHNHGLPTDCSPMAYLLFLSASSHGVSRRMTKRLKVGAILEGPRCDGALEASTSIYTWKVFSSLLGHCCSSLRQIFEPTVGGCM